MLTIANAKHDNMEAMVCPICKTSINYESLANADKKQAEILRCATYGISYEGESEDYPPPTVEFAADKPRFRPKQKKEKQLYPDLPGYQANEEENKGFNAPFDLPAGSSCSNCKRNKPDMKAIQCGHSICVGCIEKYGYA